MAVSTRIVYNPVAVGGIHVANAVRYIIAAKEAADRAAAMGAAVTAGGATQANMEGSAEFNAAAGQGATLYSAIISLQTALNAITASQLANLDAGG